MASPFAAPKQPRQTEQEYELSEDWLNCRRSQALRTVQGMTSPENKSKATTEGEQLAKTVLLSPQGEIPDTYLSLELSTVDDSLEILDLALQAEGDTPPPAAPKGVRQIPSDHVDGSDYDGEQQIRPGRPSAIEDALPNQHHLSTAATAIFGGSLSLVDYLGSPRTGKTQAQKPKPPLTLMIEIAPGQKHPVTLHEGDSCSALALEFVRKHDLPRGRVWEPLTAHLQRALDSHLQSFAGLRDQRNSTREPTSIGPHPRRHSRNELPGGVPATSHSYADLLAQRQPNPASQPHSTISSEESYQERPTTQRIDVQKKLGGGNAVPGKENKLSGLARLHALAQPRKVVQKQAKSSSRERSVSARGIRSATPTRRSPSSRGPAGLPLSLVQKNAQPTRDAGAFPKKHLPTPNRQPLYTTPDRKPQVADKNSSSRPLSSQRRNASSLQKPCSTAANQKSLSAAKAQEMRQRVSQAKQSVGSGMRTAAATGTRPSATKVNSAARGRSPTAARRDSTLPRSQSRTSSAASRASSTASVGDRLYALDAARKKKLAEKTKQRQAEREAAELKELRKPKTNARAPAVRRALYADPQDGFQQETTEEMEVRKFCTFKPQIDRRPLTTKKLQEDNVVPAQQTQNQASSPVQKQKRLGTSPKEKSPKSQTPMRFSTSTTQSSSPVPCAPSIAASPSERENLKGLSVVDRLMAAQRSTEQRVAELRAYYEHVDPKTGKHLFRPSTTAQ